jgi:hypothetical protein
MECRSAYRLVGALFLIVETVAVPLDDNDLLGSPASLATVVHRADRAQDEAFSERSFENRVLSGTPVTRKSRASHG